MSFGAAVVVKVKTNFILEGIHIPRDHMRGRGMASEMATWSGGGLIFLGNN